MFNDTIIAPATVPGTGAISLIRVSGSKAFEFADSLISWKKGDATSSSGGRVKFGTIVWEDGSVLDEILCCIYRAPHSYTGEDSVEIMCHASSYIVSCILQRAISLGCRMAQPGEFTRRAFLSGKMDLTQAEAVADVIASSTAASHRVAISQLKGGFSSQLSSLREKLLEMTSLLELELDFSEEDVEFADRSKLLSLVDEVLAQVNALSSSFKLGNAIKNGVPVAIVGATNAGKSTLLNAILGEQRAIVSPIAGTTRDTIEECFNVDGVLYRFVDTAGIRSTDGEIERIGIERSFQSLQKADAVIFILDSSILSSALSGFVSEPEKILSTEEYLSAILSRVDFAFQKVIFAFNKIDICEKEAENTFVKMSNTIVSYINKQQNKNSNVIIEPSFVTISAKNSDGVDKLLAELSSYEKKRISSASDNSVLVTNLRHYEALVTASEALLQVRSGLISNSPTDLVAEDLRSALSSIGSITGEITTTEVLGRIFGKFCIGK